MLLLQELQELYAGPAKLTNSELFREVPGALALKAATTFDKPKRAHLNPSHPEFSSESRLKHFLKCPPFSPSATFGGVLCD